MTSLFIEPSDVWLFRDGRPFSAGADRRAQSVFPPFPTVTAGVIRTSYLYAQDVPLNLYNSEKSKESSTITNEQVRRAYTQIGRPFDGDYGNLQLSGPYLAIADDAGNVTRYYPAPADLYLVDKRYLIPTVEDISIQANWPSELGTHLLWLNQPEARNAEGWLSATTIEKYLDAKAGTEWTDLEVVKSGQLFKEEQRLGIELGSGKTTVEGMLYTVGFTRACWGYQRRIGLSLELQSPAWWGGSSGVLSLGGERRAGLYYTVDGKERTAKGRKEGKQLKVYFATPAYFNTKKEKHKSGEQEEEITLGWQPANWSDFFSGNPKLVAAAVNSLLSVGGFDLARNRHKPVRRYVPAGSVYYLKSENDGELVYNGKPITDADGAIGFGQVLIGEW